MNEEEQTAVNEEVQSDNRRMSISLKTLNDVLNVLAELPFKQVANSINEIQSDVRPIVQSVDEQSPEAVNQ